HVRAMMRWCYQCFEYHSTLKRAKVQLLAACLYTLGTVTSTSKSERTPLDARACELTHTDSSISVCLQTTQRKPSSAIKGDSSKLLEYFLSHLLSGRFDCTALYSDIANLFVQQLTRTQWQSGKRNCTR